MKTTIAFTLMALAITLSTQAQPGRMQGEGQGQNMENRMEERRAEIEKRKVAYLSTELNLTVDEAQRFWPVYNAYMEEKRSLRSHGKEAYTKGRSEEEALTTEQLDARMQARFAHERARVDIDEKYYAEMKNVLPPAKVAQFYQAERDFRREVMRSMRKQGPDGERPAQGPGERRRQGKP